MLWYALSKKTSRLFSIGEGGPVHPEGQGRQDSVRYSCTLEPEGLAVLRGQDCLEDCDEPTYQYYF